MKDNEILEETNEKSNEEVYTDEEEAALKKRLRDLGYI